MAVKDLGFPVKNDESNIMKIIELENLDEKIGTKLKKANGMRNIIVHRYNSFEEELVLNSIEEIRTLLMNWLEILEEVMTKFD